ncbi:MAG: hypothetical protein R3202_14080, partial [Candidatus Competibacterales bacterium]|nr:hypothetical protein [Candidatus Competibacterales bacterium]
MTPALQPTVQPAPVELHLVAVEATEDDGHFVLVLEHNAGTLEPRLSRLRGPSRLILDLPGRWGEGANRAPEPIAGEIVSQVRFGR